MKTGHITEEQIQEFQFENIPIPGYLSTHLENCTECRRKMEEYTIVIKALSNHEKPAFDFNLDRLVMDRINESTKKTAFSASIVVSWVLVFIGVTSSALFFYTQYGTLITLFSGLNKICILLVAIAIVAITVFQLVELNLRYKKTKNQLSI